MSTVSSNKNQDSYDGYLHVNELGKSNYSKKEATTEGTLSVPVRVFTELSAWKKAGALWSSLRGRCEIITIGQGKSEKKVVVEVNTLARVLSSSKTKNIDEKQIQELVAEKKGSSLIHFLANEALVRVHTSKILKNRPNLTSDEDKSELTSATREAIRVLNAVSGQLTQNQMVEFESKGCKFQAKLDRSMLDQSGDLKLIKIDQHLGRGAFASVRKVVNLNTGQVWAQKLNRSDLIEEKRTIAVQDVRKDHEIRMKINTKHNIWGVQGPPGHKVTIIKVEKIDGKYRVLSLKEKPREGMLAELEGPDLKRYEFKSGTELWGGMHQIIHGWKFLHNNHYVHGDIKPANILTKKIEGKEGQVLVRISDLGGLKKIDDPNFDPSELFKLDIYSPEYCCQDDRDALEDLAEAFIQLASKLPDPKAYTKQQEIIEEVKVLRGKMDGYATGLVLYKIMAKFLGDNRKDPHPCNAASPDYISLDVKMGLLLEKFPEMKDEEIDALIEMNLLLEGLLTKDYTSRSDANEVAEGFSSILNVNIPNLNKELTKVKEEYERPHNTMA